MENPSLRNSNSKRSPWLRGSQVCLQQQKKDQIGSEKILHLMGFRYFSTFTMLVW